MKMRQLGGEILLWFPADWLLNSCWMKTCCQTATVIQNVCQLARHVDHVVSWCTSQLVWTLPSWQLAPPSWYGLFPDGNSHIPDGMDCSHHATHTSQLVWAIPAANQHFPAGMDSFQLTNWTIPSRQIGLFTADNSHILYGMDSSHLATHTYHMVGLFLAGTSHLPDGMDSS